jgi:hypothetical protein
MMSSKYNKAMTLSSFFLHLSFWNWWKSDRFVSGAGGIRVIIVVSFSICVKNCLSLE